ncbi:MAG: energy transducer TonB, partial [Terriglobia bacterium]
TIPKEIAQIVDPPDADTDFPPAGVTGGVPGGVPGGQVGGVLGGILSATPPPVEAPPQKPIRVGGNVRRPRLIKHVQPKYPSIAKLARIEGVVRIDAIIDTHGRVVRMKVVSGHPLLANAALNAVQGWLFEPTYLNGQPVPLAFEIKVTFQLG